MGYLYESRKRWSDAINIYEKLIQASPNCLEALFRIGKCWEVQKQYGKALETYRRSLKLDINQPNVMKALEEVKKMKDKEME